MPIVKTDDELEDKYRKIYARRLRRVMELRGMDAGELAEVAGVARPTINYYLSGKRTPKFRELIRLAFGLKVSLDWMIGRKETVTVRTGEWEDYEDGYFTLYRCSRCGYKAGASVQGKAYCQQCGAKMAYAESRPQDGVFEAAESGN